MAFGVGKHLLRHAKAIKDDLVRRTTTDIVDRLNELTQAFAGADGGTKKFLRADLTWSDRTEKRIIGAPAFLPATIGNWTPPDGSTDYWLCGGAGATRIAVALPVSANERIIEVGMTFYRGQATDPTTRVLLASTGASASVATVETAWTTPSATGSWETLVGGYDLTPTGGNWVLDITARPLDRVRSAYVRVEPF